MLLDPFTPPPFECSSTALFIRLQLWTAITAVPEQETTAFGWGMINRYHRRKAGAFRVDQVPNMGAHS
jgi:hypothetical protein